MKGEHGWGAMAILADNTAAAQLQRVRKAFKILLHAAEYALNTYQTYQR